MPSERSGTVTGPEDPTQVLREPGLGDPPELPNGDPPNGASPTADLTPEQAGSLLDLMLDSNPPELPEDSFRIDRLNSVVRLRALSEAELEQIGERSMRQPTRVERDQGLSTRVRDQQKLQVLTVSEAMVEPNLRDGRVLSRHGPRPEDVVIKWFLPGEIMKMSDFITDLSGWSDTAVTRAGKS